MWYAHCRLTVSTYKFTYMHLGVTVNDKSWVINFDKLFICVCEFVLCEIHSSHSKTTHCAFNKNQVHIKITWMNHEINVILQKSNQLCNINHGCIII